MRRKLITLCVTALLILTCSFTAFAQDFAPKNRGGGRGGGACSRCFYLPQHRTIYTIMQEIDTLGGKIDPLIVLEKLKNEKVFLFVGRINPLGKSFNF